MKINKGTLLAIVGMILFFILAAVNTFQLVEQQNLAVDYCEQINVANTLINSCSYELVNCNSGYQSLPRLGAIECPERLLGFFDWLKK